MNDLTRRTLHKMFNPRPDPLLEEALETIAVQAATIEAQRRHIHELNQRLNRVTGDYDTLASFL